MSAVPRSLERSSEKQCCRAVVTAWAHTPLTVPEQASCASPPTCVHGVILGPPRELVRTVGDSLRCCLPLPRARESTDQ